MTYARIVHAPTTSAGSVRNRDARHLFFFKIDRPRAIDRYIDYFGGAGSVAGTHDDLRGETLLERFA